VPSDSTSEPVQVLTPSRQQPPGAERPPSIALMQMMGVLESDRAKTTVYIEKSFLEVVTKERLKLSDVLNLGLEMYLRDKLLI